jgi:Kef-type K+ transport system membrane component KefB
VVLYVVLRLFDRAGMRTRLHEYSEKRRFALELRISLIILFALAALAVSTHVSIMLAGFALGLVIGAIGEPRRLARQLFGITEGFFSPLFFVWLGASLQVRDLGAHPKFILLGAALGLGALLAHCVGWLLRQPITLALLSAAQLGVPVAAATIGTQEKLLAAGEPSALMFGALLTIGSTSVAGVLAARGSTAEDAKQRAAEGRGPRQGAEESKESPE